MNRRNCLPLLVASVLAVGVLAGCGSSSGSGTSTASSGSSSSGGMMHAQVMLDWVPNPDHLGLYTTLAKGYWKAQHLSVTLQPPSNVSDVAKLVANGNAPLGISYEPDTIIARSQNLPIVAVGALIPVALNSVIAPARSGIKSAADLKGHSVGVAGLPADYAFLKAISEKEGFPLSSAKTVNVGSNLLPAVVSGKVDSIIGGYRNVEAIQVRDQGLKPTVIPVTDAGVPQYDELVIIANAQKLKSDPSYQRLVRAFLAGLAKGNAVAVAHPSTGIAAMQNVIKGYPANQIHQMVATTAPLLNNPLGFGRMSQASWQHFADWMLKNKLITKPVQASTVITNAYLPGH